MQDKSEVRGALALGTNCCDKPFRCLALRHPGLLTLALACVHPSRASQGNTFNSLLAADSLKLGPSFQPTSGLLLLFLFVQQDHRYGTHYLLTLIHTQHTLTAPKTAR